jgi:hypothetical protein
MDIELIGRNSYKKKIVPTISKEKIRIILKEHHLKPWREKMWCIPKLDAEYIERMEDVLDTYEKPYNGNEPVVCLDEKPVQLLADSRSLRPAKKSGDITKRDYEYKRCGTANVFCGIEPKAGKHFTKVTTDRKGPALAQMLADIDSAYPTATTIHLVMDNLNTHRIKSCVTLLGEEKGTALWNRFTVHYTPKHASWLDQAEIEIGIYSSQCLGKTRTPSIEELIKKSTAWNMAVNEKQLKINWGFTKSDARRKFKYDLGKN